MLDVWLQGNPSIAGAIEIIQVLLHLKRFYYDFYLQCVTLLYSLPFRLKFEYF